MGQIFTHTVYTQCWVKYFAHPFFRLCGFFVFWSFTISFWVIRYCVKVWSTCRSNYLFTIFCRRMCHVIFWKDLLLCLCGLDKRRHFLQYLILTAHNYMQVRNENERWYSSLILILFNHVKETRKKLKCYRIECKT